MKYPALFLCIFLAFFMALSSGPAFAGNVDNNPGNCPFPSYSGCKRYVEGETHHSKEDKDGLVYAGGGSPTDNFIYGEVHSNELFVRYNSVIINEKGAIVDLYGGAAPMNSQANRNNVYLSSLSQANNVYGGYSKGRGTMFNGVEVNNATAHGDVVGGWSDSTVIGQSSTNNTLRLSNATIVKGDATGGQTTGGGVNASLNQVLLYDNATVEGSAYGGRTTGGGDVSQNVVNVTNNSSIGKNVYGGHGTGSGRVSANIASVGSGSNIVGGLYGGYGEGTGLVVSNRAEAGGGTVSDVFGGYSVSGNTQGNMATVSGGSVAGSVYGGRSGNTGSATGNTASISSGTVGGSLYGGYSASGLAASNQAEASGGMVFGSLYGGYSELGNTQGNMASVTGGTVAGSVVGGGHNDTGVSVGDAAYITGGNVTGDVYGARAPDGAYNSFAEISSAASTIGGSLIGGESNADATGNTAGVSAGTVTGSVVGGRGGNAVDNSAHVSAGMATGGVVGGVAYNGVATGNSVSVSGGAIGSYTIPGTPMAAIGGYNTVDGAVSGNTVSLSGGAFGGDIVGGLTDSTGFINFVSNNTVNLEPGLGANALAASRVLGSLHTGNMASGVGTINMLNVGNTLNANGFMGSVQEVNNFQNYNFQISDSLAPGGTAIAITGATPTRLTTATGIGFSFLPGGGVTQYQNGDEFVLIDKVDGNSGLDMMFSNVAKGVSTLYDVAVYEDAATNALRARIGGRDGNKQAETLSSPIVSGLTLVNLGADLVAGNALNQAWKTAKNCEKGGRWSFFSSFTYEDMEIDGRVNTNGWSNLVGMAWRDGNNCDYGFLGGAFFETGDADYDGGHNYRAGRAEYSGNVRYNGVGVLSRYRFENRLRLEASLRGGKVDSDYSAQQYAGNQHPRYDLNPWYYGAHLGAGWDLDVTDAFNLDFSAKYFWVHQKGETVGVMGERVRFDDADSHRVKAGVRLSYMPHKRFDVFAGAWYEHELGGSIDADNRTTGEAIRTLNMDGASGVFELGVSILPIETRNVTLDLALTGSTGTREGIGGHLSLCWNF